jgi:hypothetical protein
MMTNNPRAVLEALRDEMRQLARHFDATAERFTDRWSPHKND